MRKIEFEGVSAERLAPLPEHLAQAVGQPLRRDSLQRSLRQLFATGFYETVQADGSRLVDGLVLTFRGTPRSFIGRVSVEGAKGANINTQLSSAAQLVAGTRMTTAKLTQAVEQMRASLAENGFHEPVITPTLTPRPDQMLVDIAFHVDSGPQARIGTVEVTGDPGMSAVEFSRLARLRAGKRVNHETGNRALAGVLKHYQKEDRLEAEIKIESQTYKPATKATDFLFSSSRGPVVHVMVEGVKLSADRVKHIIPIFEEGTVDDDLLKEGNRRLRDYYQRQGYFGVKVSYEQRPTQGDLVSIFYTVRLGMRRSVQKVSVAGNHYFNNETLRQLLSVHAADAFDRHGAYSQSLVAADIAALQAVYKNNGFSDVKITPEVNSADAAATADSGQPAIQTTAAPATRANALLVVYQIAEGPQQRVRSVQIDGSSVDSKQLLAMMNTEPGQLLSPQKLAGDRDTLLTYFLSQGFDRARVDVTQKPAENDPKIVDIQFHVEPGQQIFVRNILLTGLHYTRPQTVAPAITLHPGDPLSETALADTQRNLYDFALFNEVDTAIVNPGGDEAYKTVLLQTEEARRWALTYGFGFEAQTGTPQNNCRFASVANIACNPNGRTGVSFRGLADLTRNNLFGREQSASLRGTYGLLETKVDLLYQNPHFFGNRNIGFTLSGGYATSQDVTTYVASRLDAGIRFTQHFSSPASRISKANTFIYEYNFRRVKVAEDSLEVYFGEINELSTAVRVAGPSITWIRDTRDSPLDAHRGTYSSVQEFLSIASLGAQAQFNRLDLSNSSYYPFDKGRFVLARNTRYGQERAYGSSSGELIPLPERLYAGGASSMRGYSINAAGPRDPETGYPIGGAGALVNSTELRLPPPTLPWVGTAVSLVLFHDMGNVFTNASDAWPSLLRTRQPDRSNCAPSAGVTAATFVPAGPVTSTGQQGACSFNYFSHAPGMGVRYHTPVGPIRIDFSYNLNPPIYPAIEDYTNPAAAPHIGEASHFNFFFSLGQTF